MSTSAPKNLIIIDEQFEKIEGHYYEYDKSVSEIFEHHGFKSVIYGHKNMLPMLRDELGARPWFTFNAKSKIRKIPVLGAILYRTGFWKKYEREVNGILAGTAGNDNKLVFFPNVYWYNILPMARALKKTDVSAALLYRVSVFDAIGLPKSMSSVTLAIIRHSLKLLANNKKVHFFSDSEVIADEWTTEFKVPMKVLPIPHLTLNTKDAATTDTGKIRMYLPGGMRVEKGAQMLTEAFELLAVKQPELMQRIVLVTQFLGGDEILEGFRGRLAALPVENEFLKHLTTEEYNRQLSLADVILIPYQLSEGYRARTSGILAEAIASSKPFITTDGTWMSLQARKFDTGLIVQDKQPVELTTAIETLVSNYADYDRKAKAACTKWMTSQSKEVFYQQLLTALH